MIYYFRQHSKVRIEIDTVLSKRPRDSSCEWQWSDACDSDNMADAVRSNLIHMTHIEHTVLTLAKFVLYQKYTRTMAENFFLGILFCAWLENHFICI